jgi:hypothetical protein
VRSHRIGTSRAERRGENAPATAQVVRAYKDEAAATGKSVGYTTARPAPSPFNSVDDLMRLHTNLNNSLSTLLWIHKNYCGEQRFRRMLEAVGGTDSTPDNGYFGPAPNFSAAPTADGVAALGGFVADFGLAVTGVVKQHLALVKEIKRYEKDSTELKRAVMFAYCALVDTLGGMIIKCTNLEEAKKFHRHGLNHDPIASEAWKKVSEYRWCATVS